MAQQTAASMTSGPSVFVLVSLPPTAEVLRALGIHIRPQVLNALVQQPGMAPNAHSAGGGCAADDVTARANNGEPVHDQEEETPMIVDDVEDEEAMDVN